jgi:DNA-binding NarL/FixJ family response regulator
MARGKRPAPLRVVVADDHRLMLEALLTLFEPVEDVDVVGSTHLPERVRPLLASLEPDLLLLDAEMGGAEAGMLLLRSVRASYPGVAVVLLTEALDPERTSTALLTHGVKGVVEKGCEPAAVAPAVRAAMRGEAPVVGGTPPPSAESAFGLTDREEGVLLSLARGRSNEEIARELQISRTTVKFHLHNAYGKLGVENRVEALRAMVEHAIFGDSAYDWNS